MLSQSGKETQRREGRGKNESRGNEVDLSPAALGLEVNLKLTHSFGTNVVSNRNNVEIVTISDEGGNEREYVLAPAGQHLGLTRVDDGRMCFIEGTNSKVRPGSVREIVAMNLSYNGKHIAVCEKIIEPKDPSTVASLADIAKGAESGASAVVAAATTALAGAIRASPKEVPVEPEQGLARAGAFKFRAMSRCTRVSLFL